MWYLAERITEEASLTFFPPTSPSCFRDDYWDFCSKSYFYCLTPVTTSFTVYLSHRRSFPMLLSSSRALWAACWAEIAVRVHSAWVTSAASWLFASGPREALRKPREGWGTGNTWDTLQIVEPSNQPTFKESFFLFYFWRRRDSRIIWNVLALQVICLPYFPMVVGYLDK